MIGIAILKELMPIPPTRRLAFNPSYDGEVVTSKMALGIKR
jgi:hypothetical protein